MKNFYVLIFGLLVTCSTNQYQQKGEDKLESDVRDEIPVLDQTGRMGILRNVNSTANEKDVADESVEPPLSFSIRIDAVEATTTEGGSVEIEGTFTNPKVSVVTQPHRLFPYEGIKFKYPRSFGFEANVDDKALKSWILSGNDFKVTYTVLTGSLSAAQYVDAMLEQFGIENTKVTNSSASIELGGVDLPGVTFSVDIAGHQMVMEVYKVPSENGKTKFLIFQDNSSASGERSPEFKRTIADIKTSFEFQR